MENDFMIERVCHPHYTENILEWFKWRTIKQGGQRFINQYLEQLPKEMESDFEKRKSGSPNPAFAKMALIEIKNSIFQRLIDVVRTGGPDSYQLAVEKDVDFKGSSMNYFMGELILLELLFMGRVGIYVDKPPLPNNTLYAARTVRPYMYLYETEDIKSWSYADQNKGEFSNILLRDYVFAYDKKTGLPGGQKDRYRHYWISEGQVWAQFYNQYYNTQAQAIRYAPESEPILLGLDKIPFHVLDIKESLLTEIANYQITLLNMESSDKKFFLEHNFPTYTEQYSPRAFSEHLRSPTTEGEKSTDGSTRTVNLGMGTGRQYPAGTERPGYISPPSDNIKVSMEKQQQIKETIRLLVNLGLTNLEASLTSAEAKGIDEHGLESGLSALALELEKAERRIAEFWCLYEGVKEFPTIKYPEKYDLRPDADRRKEAIEIAALIPKVASVEYQKRMAKRLADIMLGAQLSYDEMEKIYRQIDSAPFVVIEPDVLDKDLERGLISNETASKAKGYPEGEVEKAADEHAKRLERIAISQSEGIGSNVPNPGARGLKDKSDNPGEQARQEKTESRDNTKRGDVQDRTRGQGKEV